MNLKYYDKEKKSLAHCIIKYDILQAPEQIKKPMKQQLKK